MRLLGIDFGFKRIGLAIGESEHGIVTQRPFVEASGTLARDAQRIVEMARKEGIDQIVIGIPLEDGEEGRMARICRTLAGHIEEGGFRVDLVDETLTSVEADGRLKESDPGMKASQRRKVRDGAAARLILERFMAESIEKRS